MEEERIREILTEHSRHPFGKTLPEQSLGHAKEINPFCGDELTVFLDRGTTGFRFVYQGQGCSVCMASASILASTVQSDSVTNLTEQYRKAASCIVNPDTASSAEFEEWQALAYFRKNPRRLACVEVAWKAAATVIGNYPSAPSDQTDPSDSSHHSAE